MTAAIWGAVLDAPFPIAGTPLVMGHRDDLNLLRQFSENHEEGVAVKQNSSGPIKIRGANLRDSLRVLYASLSSASKPSAANSLRTQYHSNAPSDSVSASG